MESWLCQDFYLVQERSDVIVSLTSFPSRINDVYLVIKCMLRQTVLPKKIILWLSQPQFEGVEIPEKLLCLENEIFEVRFVDGDIRSHKKYHYAIKEYPNDWILLIDDDIYYPSDMLQKMIDARKVHPDSLICRYGSVILFDNSNLPLPFHSWWWEVSSDCDDQNFFLGTGGGVLFHPKMLYKDVVDVDLALKLTPLADDIWFNAMVNLKGTRKYKIKTGLLLQIENQQIVRLTSQNTGENKNDIQFEAIIRHYTQTLKTNPFANRQSVSLQNRALTE
jgi:hypothetical protein